MTHFSFRRSVTASHSGTVTGISGSNGPNFPYDTVSDLRTKNGTQSVGNMMKVGKSRQIRGGYQLPKETVVRSARSWG